MPTASGSSGHGLQPTPCDAATCAVSRPAAAALGNGRPSTGSSRARLTVSHQGSPARTPSAALRALSACSASNCARFLAIALGMAPGSRALAAAAASAPALSSQGALRAMQAAT